jgi:hypothetical protein
MTISPYQIDGILKFYSKMNEASERRSGPDPQKERDCDRVTLSSPDNKTVVYNRISETLLDMIIKGAPQESDPVE